MFFEFDNYRREWVYGIVFIVVICLCCCGGVIETEKEIIIDDSSCPEHIKKLVNEHSKPTEHKDRITMIMCKLEDKGEFIVQMFLGIIPVELRSVDFDDDGKKDILVIVGVPGYPMNSMLPGNITLYFVDKADNGFGTVDIVEIGEFVEGYLMLGAKNELTQIQLNAVNSFYEKTVDLGADIILFTDQLEDILKQRNLEQESLEKRNVDKEFEILFGQGV